MHDDEQLLIDPKLRDAVVAVLAHVAFSDGVVQPSEFVYIQRLLPHLSTDELKDLLDTAASTPLDTEVLAAQITSVQDRWRLLRFAARMAWSDRELQSSEKSLLVELAAGLGLPTDALETVLDDLIGWVESPVTLDKIEASLQNMSWDDLTLNRGPSRDELGNVVPADATVVARLCVDRTEQVIVTDRGFAAGFKEGDNFIEWERLISYSRVPVFGAAVRLMTGKGAFTLVDVRLRTVATWLDRVYGT